MVRRAAVAGMFYDGDVSELRRSVEDCFMGTFGPGRAPEVSGERQGRVLGLVCPHAGYIYSGAAAAWAYNALAEDGVPDIAVIIGPNHQGVGAAVAVATEEDQWSTPLGALSIDMDVARSILKSSQAAQGDNVAHFREHSIEVQLPFLQYLGADKTRIVPICIAHVSYHDALVLLTDLGSAIAKAIKGKSAVIIASTDFSHYESKASAQAKDTAAIDRILAMDPQGLIQTVHDRQITMCGAVGTAIMLQACKTLGATTARKLTYYTSGDVTGDLEQVVGYGAVAIES
ncbi:MAG: AmmeMemoRadiSam system protein B [Armatimonadota bacterium]|nr:AmmeMemoRadiSam system protein B [bacterium]